MSQKAKKKSDSQDSNNKELETAFLGQVVEVEDPVATFIAKNSKHILTAVLVGLAVWFGYGYFQDQQAQQRKSAADLLANVQASLNEFESQEKLSDADVNKIEGNLKALNDAVAPYPQVASFYSIYAQVKAKTLKADQVKFTFAKGYSAGEQRFFEELQDFLQAKYLIDLKPEQAKSALETLAKQGQYVAVASAGAIARLANAKSEKEGAVKIIDDVSKRQPESAALLEKIRQELVS